MRRALSTWRGDAAVVSLLAWLATLFQYASQETLTCGANSFQITFEPSRPIFSNTFVAAAAAAAAAAASSTSGAMSNNDDSASAVADGATMTSATLGGSASTNFAFPTAKYVFRPLSQFIPKNVSLCNSSAVHLPYAYIGGDQASSVDALESKMVITKCEECARCAHELSNAHRILSRVAVDAGLQSLLVIVHVVADGDETGGTFISSSRDIERVKLVENTIAKFIFINEEPGQLSVCEVMADSIENDALKNFSKTSVLFVSISFIILMVISLAWLVFYYVQRFRYAHAKDRLQRRLFNAAKKALARIPTRPVKAGDKDLEMDCPVCIDPYKTGDIVRMLPCRHTFHKGCVDPWLLEHRTCPMCKSDILKAFGYQVTANASNGSSSSASSGLAGRRRTQYFDATTADASVRTDSEFQHYHPVQHHCASGYPHRTSFNVATDHSYHGDRPPWPIPSDVHGAIDDDEYDDSRRSNHARSAIMSSAVPFNFERTARNVENSDRISVYDDHSTKSESNGFSFPVISEIHDPFGLTPTTALMQVICTSNPHAISVLPLAVHSVGGEKGGKATTTSAVVDPSMLTIETVHPSTDINTIPYNSCTGYSKGYGRYSIGGDSSGTNIVRISSQPISPRPIYSAEDMRRMRNAPRRFFRASTASGVRQSSSGHRHVVNLIHVRSHSLNHGQFPSASSLTSALSLATSSNTNDVEQGSTITPDEPPNDTWRCQCATITSSVCSNNDEAPSTPPPLLSTFCR